MKLASILPVKNIKHTFDGDYAMLLAHLKDYYPENTNKNCYVIMDNSLIEKENAIDIIELYKAAKQCGADEIIIPDVLQDSLGTLMSLLKSYELLKEYTCDHIDIKLMAVCQGKTLEEFINCYTFLETCSYISTIGIPKIAETLHENGRPGLEDLWVDSRKNIHLLGCYTSLNEIRNYKYPSRIRSIDTCIPALLSQTSRNVWATRPDKTIDLIRDEINDLNYHTMMLQLRKERWI